MTYQTAFTRVSIGAFSSRPAPGTVNQTYYCTDGGGAYLDDGTAWRPLIGGAVGTAPPGALTFTAINQGSSSLVSSNGGLLMTGVNDGTSSPPLRGYIVAADGQATDFVESLIPSAEGLTATTGTFPEIGVFMRESSSGKMVTVGFQVALSSVAYGQFTFYHFTGPNTDFVSKDKTDGWPFPQDPNSPMFLRLRLSLTTTIAEYSRDRIVWTQVDSQSSAWTSKPDQVGIYSIGSGVVPKARIAHFLSGH